MKVRGEVVHGDKKGREFGFPTANIANDGVGAGIYAGRVILGSKEYMAAIYVGRKRQGVLEAHILDFNADIYGMVIEVVVGERLRDDELVSDVSELKRRIASDIETIRACLQGS